MERHYDVRAGDTFDSPGGYVRVTRVGKAGWIDIAVSQPNGATWTKRMPTGIPVGWVRLSRG
jgi:hypothetical protein